MKKDGQKEKIVSKLSTNKSSTSNVESGPWNAPTDSELNLRLANLLFDLQGDKNHDHVCGATPARGKESVKDTLKQKQLEKPLLLGVLGKCIIDGCNVHVLTATGNILEHIEVNKPMAPEFKAAREYLLRAADSAVGVLVYKDFMEVIRLDGSTERI